MPAKDLAVDSYIAGVDPAIQPIMKAARAAIRKGAPMLEETICRGLPHWRGKGWVFYIADHAQHVNLGFHQGANLRDGRRLLEGTGKGLRHVKLRSVADARKAHLAALIRDAVAYDARTAERVPASAVGRGGAFRRPAGAPSPRAAPRATRPRPPRAGMTPSRKLI